MKHIDLFKKVIFTNKDVLDNFNSQTKANYWLKSALKNRQILMIRKGLYTVVDPIYNMPYVDQYMVGSNINEDCYMSYHSALAYHGLSTQIYRVFYVSSKKRFNTFEFGGAEFIRVPYQFKEGVICVNKEVDIYVTDLERTLIDCIDNLWYSGDIEEVVNALNMITTKLDENKLLKYLSIYNKKVLYQKAGYIFEQFNDVFHFSEKFFEECVINVGKKCLYYMEGNHMYGKKIYHKRWNIIAPEILEDEYLRGLYE